MTVKQNDGHYEISPSAETVHSIFWRDYAPILTIRPDDRVRYETLCARGQAVVDGALVTQDHLFTERPREGHALCGPIAIEGAKVGMTLEVVIESIVPDVIGWNIGGGSDWDYWTKLGVGEGEPHRVFWDIDAEAGLATMRHLGYQVKIAPFMGVMGMPPNDPQKHPTGPPTQWGGNMDCKLLTAGSRLFLPIPVDGALFSVGDGHSAQGDGEVSGTAIETPMKQVDLTFHLHPDLSLTTPRAETPAGLVTLAFHEDLDEAMLIALNAMLDWMSERYSLSRKDALALASIAVDLHITQVVNGAQGVHALLPKDAVIFA